MSLINLPFILLILTTLSIFFMMILINKTNTKQKQINKFFFTVLLCIFIISIGVISQSIGYYIFNINPIYFEYFIYIGTCFLPVSLFFTSIVFSKSKIVFNKFYLLLFIIPILSLILLWTNNWHHLFFTLYSFNLNEMKTGNYVIIHYVYTYLLLAISIFNLIKYSVKNAGFFSKQSLLIVIGSLIPIIVNILGTFGIIPMSVYVTPICFSFTILFFALAIFKFKFLSITPIAMQRIVDRISDSFIVINDENVITDFNQTFLKTFNLSDNKVRNTNFLDLIKYADFAQDDIDKMMNILDNCKVDTGTYQFKKDFKINDKYFNIEVNGIFSKDSFLGNLVLLKDVTQHILDMKTIEDNQSMLMEKERLASLGQMIGGIAHNLKTPIMSIAGATEGLLDLTKEYDISIGDPEVTNEDHHAIVKDMNEWIEKIKEYTEYMSNVITAVKGQAVNFADETSDSFTINEAIKYIDVLMKHELKNALVSLNIDVQTDSNTSIKGNINSFVQVVNNLISNAIQAYTDQPNKVIDFVIKKVDNDIQFIIQDYGSGIPESVQEKLFKEMITTKGKNGTGLGLFMSFSNIRAHFNGNMTFESKEGKGTKFIITIPVM